MQSLFKAAMESLMLAEAVVGAGDAFDGEDNELLELRHKWLAEHQKLEAQQTKVDSIATAYQQKRALAVKRRELEASNLRWRIKELQDEVASLRSSQQPSGLGQASGAARGPPATHGRRANAPHSAPPTDERSSHTPNGARAPGAAQIPSAGRNTVPASPVAPGLPPDFNVLRPRAGSTATPTGEMRPGRASLASVRAGDLRQLRRQMHQAQYDQASYSCEATVDSHGAAADGDARRPPGVISAGSVPARNGADAVATAPFPDAWPANPARSRLSRRSYESARDRGLSIIQPERLEPNGPGRGYQGAAPTPTAVGPLGGGIESGAAAAAGVARTGGCADGAPEPASASGSDGILGRGLVAPTGPPSRPPAGPPSGPPLGPPSGPASGLGSRRSRASTPPSAPSPTGPPAIKYRLPALHSNAVTSIAPTDWASCLVSGGGDGFLQLVERGLADEWSVGQRLSCGAGAVNALVNVPLTKTIVAGCEDATCRLFRIADAHEDDTATPRAGTPTHFLYSLRSLKGHTKEVMCLAALTWCARRPQRRRPLLLAPPDLAPCPLPPDLSGSRPVLRTARCASGTCRRGSAPRSSMATPTGSWP